VLTFSTFLQLSTLFTVMVGAETVWSSSSLFTRHILCVAKGPCSYEIVSVDGVQVKGDDSYMGSSENSGEVGIDDWS